MAERIRTVQNGRRRRLEPRERSPSCEQISNECFAARDELVREHVPRPRLEAAIPIGRVGRQSDIVGTVIYLASNAGAYTTGATIKVDGGSALG